jgi:transketolase
MANSGRPTYMQLIRDRVNRVFDDSYTFDPYRGVILHEGADVTLVSTGYMTHSAVAAVGLLKEEHCSVEHIHFPSIKPFDTGTLLRSVKKTGSVVTVENQNIIGGIGGAVCETLSEMYPARVKRLGIPDCFGEVGTIQYLFEKHEFGPKHIAAACLEMSRG